MEKITLFQYKNPDISITIEAYFENGNLVVEGYDIGKTVDDCFGDSDYEYNLKVHSNFLPKLWEDLGITASDEHDYLVQFADRFNGNKSYSDIMDFLQERNIPFDSFSWT